MTNMGKTVSRRTTAVTMVLLGLCTLASASTGANAGEYWNGAGAQIASLSRESDLPVVNSTCESTSAERCQPMAPSPRVAKDDEVKAFECACLEPGRGKVAVIETERAPG
jgi:hypothetical protein